MKPPRAELEATLAHYADLFDRAPVGYVTLGSDGAIRRANLTFAAMVGLERPELSGRRFALFVADGHRRTFDSALEAARSGDAPASCDVRVQPVAGAARSPLFAHVTLARAAGHDECRAIVVDATARHRADEQLRAAQRMEAVGRLAGGVAHDFNNLLTVILNHAEEALDAVSARGDLEAQREDLIALKQAAERAASLTRELLAYGRKQVLRPELVDVNALVVEVATVLRPRLGDRVDLELALSGEVDRIEIDRAQIEHVAANLILHARDAMPEGGRIVVSTTSALLDAERAAALEVAPGPFVRLSIRDTRVGLDAASLPHVFEPFFTAKDGHAGSGLALSSVAGIVRQCGGHVAVRSARGHGTTFDVHLPRQVTRPVAEARPAVTRDAPPVGTETVLVVDDEEALRRVAQRALASAGYDVLVASSGEEALRICEQRTGAIHMAVSDVAMPNMTGAAFAERLRALRPETRVLFMSGYSDEVLGGRGALASTIHFIGKPFTAHALRRKVRDVLDG